MSQSDGKKMTPMMVQYLEAKKSIPPDAVLLFRLGDFYEEFFEDAETVSSVLELTLTKRQGMPMCGFPYHALDNYLPKLVAAGLKVAIAEQVEDPKLVTKGIVKREITRIITPGTVIDNSLLNSDSNNYLTAVAADRDGSLNLAALDVSTGEFFICTPGNVLKLSSELLKLGARECLISEKLAAALAAETPAFPGDNLKIMLTELPEWEFDHGEAFKFLCGHFKTTTLDWSVLYL